MRRRDLLGLTAAAPLYRPLAAAPAGQRTLRVSFNIDPTGFDPPQVSDDASLTLLAHIFESPLTYDWLQPGELRPQTCVALPDVSADFRRFVFTLKPGILFAADPAFGGRARELVAADYVFSIKRYYDPQVRSEHLYVYENAGLLGLAELRRRAIRDRVPFDYDSEVEGLRALDRYRFEVRLARPAPRFAYALAQPSYAAALAREVVQAYRDDLHAHPVGTGPFRLERWRRGSGATLLRNPTFRDERFAARPAAGDGQAAALAERLDGRRLPLIDRIEADFIVEAQPRWLAFLNGEHDAIRLPTEFAAVAVPAGRLAPWLVRRGVRMQRLQTPNVSHTFFNFDDPTVGGYAPAQVALRRAVALAHDNAAEVRLVLNGQARPAMSMIAPQTYGFDGELSSELGRCDPARANALLDLYGFADRDGDGWRERPGGSPLVLRRAAVASQRERRISELWGRQLRTVGLRVEVEHATFGELIKRTLAGSLMMWGYNWTAPLPDCDFFLGLGYGPNSEQSNDARFRLPDYDRLYERQRELPDGAERLVLIRRAERMLLAYMPYIAHHHTLDTILVQPNVRAHLRHPFRSDWGRITELGPAPA